jgi:6,7-dimethyl-8-ribityllumazine synthase
MLKIIKRKSHKASLAKFAIVASQYNTRYVDAMLRAAMTELKQAGVKNAQVVRVPGAYEIPVVASRLASDASCITHHASQSRQHAPLSAIICLGVILRGETSHAAHIGEAVSQALMHIQLQYGVPIIHEVLLLENEEQARVRCLGKKHNRGTEAAQTALAMAKVMREL